MTNLIAESFKCRDTKLPPPQNGAPMKTTGLEEFIDVLPAPVFIKDIKGTYVACNKHFADFLGYGKDDILGKKASDICPSDCVEEYTKKDMELFQIPIKLKGMNLFSPVLRERLEMLFFTKMHYLIPTERRGVLSAALRI